LRLGTRKIFSGLGVLLELIRGSCRGKPIFHWLWRALTLTDDSNLAVSSLWSWRWRARLLATLNDAIGGAHVSHVSHVSHFSFRAATRDGVAVSLALPFYNSVLDTLTRLRLHLSLFLTDNDLGVFGMIIIAPLALWVFVASDGGDMARRAAASRADGGDVVDLALALALAISDVDCRHGRNRISRMMM
jgi:hypothetical protein